jgi:hypothetical protein
MSSSWSDSEDPISAEWGVHCRAIKGLYKATQAIFVRTLANNPMYRDLTDLMGQWDSNRGVHHTIAQVCEAWNETLDVAEQQRLNVETLHLVASKLLRVGLFTGGTDLSTVYQLLYASV